MEETSATTARPRTTSQKRGVVENPATSPTHPTKTAATVPTSSDYPASNKARPKTGKPGTGPSALAAAKRAKRAEMEATVTAAGNANLPEVEEDNVKNEGKKERNRESARIF